MVVVNVYNHSTWEVDAGLTVLGSMWWKEKTDSCKLPSDPLYTHSLSLSLTHAHTHTHTHTHACLHTSAHTRAVGCRVDLKEKLNGSKVLI